MARKAPILLTAASTIATVCAPALGVGTPMIVAQASRSVDGIEGLNAPAWTPDLGTGLAAQPAPMLLSWDDSIATQSVAPRITDHSWGDDNSFAEFEFESLRRDSDDLISYSAVVRASASRAIIDPRDARPRTLNFDHLRGDRPTLAFFIPSAGTGTLMASAMLLGAPRRRKA